MAERKKSVDAVIIGHGWTGAILAKTFTDAGLSVVALDRGPARDTSPDFEFPGIAGELKYGVRGDLWQPLANETVILETGANAQAITLGSMSDVIVHSTQYMTHADALAAAKYLKTLRNPDEEPATRFTYDATERVALRNGDASKPGERIYLDNCAACHRPAPRARRRNSRCRALPGGCRIRTWRMP
jgi:choline dehydrogenase-like flavoprotein